MPYRISPIRQQSLGVPESLVSGTRFSLRGGFHAATPYAPGVSRALYSLAPGAGAPGPSEGINQLGIAVLLKYFQWEGRFPPPPKRFPRRSCSTWRRRWVPADRFTRYDLEGRMARYHKRGDSPMDGMAPRHRPRRGDHQAWVGAHTRVEEATLPHVLAHLTARYKHLKIEVPTTQRLERLAHAVTRTVEDQFFTTLAQALSRRCASTSIRCSPTRRPRCR